MKKRKTIRYYVAYSLTWLLVICFLNTITDTPIISLAGLNGYNEMESIAEWVTEDLLDIENAFPEDEEDNDVEKKSQQAGYDLYSYFPYHVSVAAIDSRSYLSTNNNTLLSRPVAIIAPPPDQFS